jgi:hypothetical protein
VSAAEQGSLGFFGKSEPTVYNNFFEATSRDEFVRFGDTAFARDAIVAVLPGPGGAEVYVASVKKPFLILGASVEDILEFLQ